MCMRDFEYEGHTVISISLRHWPTVQLILHGKPICTSILDGAAPEIQ